MWNVRKPLGNRVFFAGEHTMWPEAQAGTVHAAYQSGIRAAKELAAQLGVPLSSASPFFYTPVNLVLTFLFILFM